MPLAAVVLERGMSLGPMTTASPRLERMRQAVRDLYHRGFFEYYDPLTGEGHGARDFSWTALVLDMLARHEGQ